MDNTTLLYEREELIKSLFNVKDLRVIKKIRSVLNKKAEKAHLVQVILNDIDDEKVIEELKTVISKATKYPAL